jgi:molybdate transport repressor ModE-like protein
VEVEVRISLVVNGKGISARQLEVLAAVRDEGSKTAAAKKLGLSVPVVHKYMAAMEETVGLKLMASTPTGTELTEIGLRILETAETMNYRCTTPRGFTVSCSPVTEELLMSAISQTKVKADLVISDDETNIRSLRGGLSDMIVLDDPQYLEEVEDFEWSEVGYMDMVHVDKGPSYIRYRYGAQRIAYEQLDSDGKKYTVDAETNLLSDLLSSNKSFFVDEYLLIKRGIHLKSDTDKTLLRHSITAVYRREDRDVTRLLRAMQSKRSGLI